MSLGGRGGGAVGSLKSGPILSLGEAQFVRLSPDERSPQRGLRHLEGSSGVRTGVTVSRTPVGSLTQIASTVMSNSTPSATPRTEAALPFATAIATFR